MWERKTRDGQIFWSGNVVINGEHHQIVIFENNYRNENNSDFSIYKSNFVKKEKKSGGRKPRNKSQETNCNISNEDLPY